MFIASMDTLSREEKCDTAGEGESRIAEGYGVLLSNLR
jgi:hypothetical protein